MQAEALAAVAREIAALTGASCAPAPARSVGGGSINECYRWPAAGGDLFVKVAASAAQDAFAAEAEGLTELRAAQALRVPRVHAHGVAGSAAFLALEWIERGPGGEACERALGAGLAALHAVTARRFGWRRDNTIGATAQLNAWSADWVEFFRERRLRPQLELAARQGFARALAERGERLLAGLPALLHGHTPRASLLHGDLWGGNWLASATGEPVLFDPALYYGDRETDLAMTQLFGGFGAAFYGAYQAVAPLPAGAALRRDLYNLYHVLNHANLFGAGYAQQARAMIDRLLAELH
ncbi:MAG TPA: fructosamine kinase family protein [Steroidobacteraceae bacterium]|nr:fructosamine kinase family protein [Steroidobacteraceae bacterium]